MTSESMNKYDILDVNVEYPYKAYPSQLSMMYRVMDALNQQKHGLLESPTGTGKTMALLCSSLAWLKKSETIHDSSIEDIGKTKHKEQSKKAFKIYYCSRTHKQVSQVVRELSRSPYSKVNMDIIASRRHSCINKSALKAANIDEACKDLCKKGTDGCFFRRNIKRVNAHIPMNPWTLESMNEKFTRMKICPYYQSREWISEADIVLCPYNYILDPVIRKASNITLKNAIIIIDEAHNIEEVCRSAFSLILSQQTLLELKIQLDKAAQQISDENLDNTIIFVNKSHEFIKLLSAKLHFEYDNAVQNAWKSEEVNQLLLNNGFGEDYIKIVNNSIDQLIAKITIDKHEVIVIEDESSKVESNTVNPLTKINLSILTLLDRWISVIRMLQKKEYSRDFRFLIEEGKLFSEPLGSKSPGNWLTSRKRKSMSGQSCQNFVMNILCMNPAVVFKELTTKAYSVIVMSGTLAPINSFGKELSCTFGAPLEAFHVIKRQQVVIASVSHGPTGHQLTGVYKNVNGHPFQDELGRVVRQCCQMVPNGILCFVSSFSLMDKLYTRWKDTGLLREIEQYKTVLTEPKGNDEMTEVMQQFYELKETGVLLLAVYRGKASEGMDFSDNAARMVIAVGIPYPSVTDPNVSLKKSYNDEKNAQFKTWPTCAGTSVDSNNNESDASPVLSGSEWYSIQAYRALNQAIGRCLRHKDDWGAILLVDSRFESTRYQEGLCRWIRKWLKPYSSWGPLQMELKEFYESQQPMDTKDFE